MTDIEIATLDRVEISFAPWSWPFAAARQADIGRFFANLQRERSGVWNGRAILLNRYTVENRTLRGTCFETDYASFCAWRAWEFPDPAVANVFATAALRGADGGWLVGEMASDTAAAGRLYFPCGTPEPADVDARGMLDLTGNVGRELREETGLDTGDLNMAAGWDLVRDRSFLALMKRLTSPQSADALRGRVMRYIQSEPHSELADIHIVRSPAELDPRMPRFMTAFFEHVFAP